MATQAKQRYTNLAKLPMKLISKIIKILQLLEYWNEWNRKTHLFILWQKLSNIPEKLLLGHNRKSIRVYKNKLQHNYDITSCMSKYSN